MFSLEIRWNKSKLVWTNLLNTLRASVALTSTGFYMRATMALNGLILEAKFGDNPWSGRYRDRATIIYYGSSS